MQRKRKGKGKKTEQGQKSENCWLCLTFCRVLSFQSEGVNVFLAFKSKEFTAEQRKQGVPGRWAAAPGLIGKACFLQSCLCENHNRALNTWPLVNTGRHYYSPCARQDKGHFNIPARGSSVIVGTASYWSLWGWNKYCCRDQSCKPPITHSLSLAVEVAEENYPEHGYTTNTLNLQDTAVPVPR